MTRALDEIDRLRALIAYRCSKDGHPGHPGTNQSRYSFHLREAVDPLEKTFLAKGRSLMVLAVRNRETTPIGRQSIACNRDTLCFDRRRLMTKALAFHSHSVNYFRLARRPKIGHRPISGLQRGPSQNLHNLILILGSPEYITVPRPFPRSSGGFQLVQQVLRRHGSTVLVEHAVSSYGTATPHATSGTTNSERIIGLVYKGQLLVLRAYSRPVASRFEFARNPTTFRAGGAA
jgi:hypothetical protein